MHTLTEPLTDRLADEREAAALALADDLADLEVRLLSVLRGLCHRCPLCDKAGGCGHAAAVARWLADLDAAFTE